MSKSELKRKNVLQGKPMMEDSEKVSLKIKGKNVSYFYNNLIISREDEIDSVSIDQSGDVICRLNGYAIIPIEDYYKLIDEKLPEEITESINSKRRKLTEGTGV
jgi:hypothetical protein